MKWTSLLACAALPALLAGCGLNPKVEQFKAYQPEQAFSDTFTVASHDIPLPEGEWKMAASRTYTHNGQRPFGELYLIKTDENVVTDVLRIRTSLASGGNRGFVRGPFCDREDLIYKEVEANHEGRDQSCWGVNYYRMTRGKHSGPLDIAMLDYIKQNQLRTPNMIPYTQHRLTKYGDYLVIQHAANAEYYSDVAPVPLTAWSASAWHKDVYHKDPKKVDYYETVKERGQAWHQALKAGFATR